MIIGLDEFTNADPEQIYGRMRPDQRTAVANEFVRMLILTDDPRAEQFRYAAHDPFAASGKNYAPPKESPQVAPIVPHLLSPAQAAAVHRYTREHHPDLFDVVAHHPVTQESLAFPGAAAAEPDQTPELEHNLAPPAGMPPADDVLHAPMHPLGLGFGELERRERNPTNTASDRD